MRVHQIPIRIPIRLGVDCMRLDLVRRTRTERRFGHAFLAISVDCTASIFGTSVPLPVNSTNILLKHSFFNRMETYSALSLRSHFNTVLKELKLVTSELRPNPYGYENVSIPKPTCLVAIPMRYNPTHDDPNPTHDDPKYTVTFLRSPRWTAMLSLEQPDMTDYCSGYWWKRAYDIRQKNFVLNPKLDPKDATLKQSMDLVQTLQHRCARLEQRMMEQSLLLERFDRALTHALYRPGSQGYKTSQTHFVAHSAAQGEI